MVKRSYQVPISFSVPGRPVPKPRARVKAGAPAYYAPRPRGSKLLTYPQYQEWVRAAFRGTLHKIWLGPDTQGYGLAVRVWASNIHHGDIEGIGGSIADALQGLIWESDAQIADFHALRCKLPKGQEPRVDVEITPLGGTGFVLPIVELRGYKAN